MRVFEGCDDQNARSDSVASNPSYVVTLVHGTFARGAEWTRPHSIMSEALNRELKDVVVCYKDWSGLNAHQARFDAAEEIKNHLLGMAAAYPSSKQFVVAHSHGGNVVVYALRDKALRKTVSGVVTMGTPFVSCNARPFESTITFLSYLIAVPFGGLLAAGWIAIWRHGFAELGVTRIGNLKSGSPLLGFGLGLALWFGVRCFRALRSLLATWVSKKQQELSNRFSVGFFKHPPFYCATVDGDEPRSWLTAVSAVSGFPALLFSVKAKMVGTRTALSSIAIGILMGHHSIKWLGGAALYTTLVAWMSLCFYQFFAAFLPRLTRAHRFAYGGESILDNWLNDIKISVTPYSVGVPVEEDDLGSSSAPGLAHSVFYTDTRFIARMCKWIETISSKSSGTVDTRKLGQ
ncbi:MAG: hypothetical protein JWQ42_2728 [Edaphobacter sp.]|nr:hypothetical protein [Edaphobacter sp.]